MVELKPISESNFVDAFNLRLAPGQEKWVSHPIRSLAQVGVHEQHVLGEPMSSRKVGHENSVIVLSDNATTH